MSNTKNKKIVSQVILKLQAPYNCNTLKTSILNLALKNNLIISSKKQLFIDLKKRNKIAVTVISGPHVHKKSREQLAISQYMSFLKMTLKDKKDYKAFLTFKEQLKTLSNHSINISFTYLNNERFKI